MKKIITSALSVGALVTLAAQSSQAQSICDTAAGNLAGNCGFELGSFTDWTLTGNDVTSGLLGNLYGVESGSDPIAGTAPNSGSYQAYFSDLVSNATTITQTISTVASDTYTVSFELAQQLEGPGTVNNSVAVSFGGTTLATLTNVGVEGYALYSYTGTATSGSSVLSLKLGDDIGEFLLDDVTVTQNAAAVPNPSNAWLMLAGLGLGGGAFAFRRRTLPPHAGVAAI